MSLLTADFFSNNRKQLAESSRAELIVIAGNGLLQRNSSTTHRFQQDSNFFYLTGLSEPNMVLVIDPKHNREFLIAGEITEIGELFDGTINQTEAQQVSGISELLSYRAGWEELAKIAPEVSQIHIIEPPEQFLQNYSMYTNPARAALKENLIKFKTELADIHPEIAKLRVIKQEPEIKALRQAIDVTGQTFNLIQQNLSKYQFEYEIEADVLANFKRLARSEPAYDSIIASGANACVLHYNANKAEIDKNKTLLIDIGAQFEHYSADITRTFLPDNARAKDIHKALLKLQETALGLIKPGQNFIDYEKTMVEHYGNALKDLGLINDVLDKSTRKYMPHATSHFLGLDAHDSGEYNQAFKPGMVITVEPGFYIPEEGIGIRIEDNVLITETGNEVLSTDIPQTMALS